MRGNPQWLWQMDLTTTLGLIAGFLTTASFLPQVWKTWMTHSAQDISYGMLLLFLTGIGLWLLYGIRIQSLPIIVANVVTIFLVAVLIILKFHYNNRSINTE